MAAVFIIGLTLGSALGTGGDVGLVPSAGAGVKKYLATAAAANLPFWCLILLPRTFTHRLICGAAALFAKGAFIGCASVYILSSPSGGWRLYAMNMLPQLFFTVPLYIFALVMCLRRPDGCYSYSSILKALAAAILAAFISSCVQLVIFEGLYTIQGIFIPKI